MKLDPGMHIVMHLVFFRKIGVTKPRKKEEPEVKEAKEIKEVVASVKIKEQKPPVKTKKMTKP
jgi:quinol-cytochrome oxidoreductase complex cytochrome b subunit